MAQSQPGSCNIGCLLPLQITLQMAPYHFCGLRGHTALAAYLHSRGVSPDRPFQIASFSANGATDGSPWAKAIVVSPQETALLAGVCWLLYQHDSCTGSGPVVSGFG
jgi:hypothetical protein